MPPGMHYPDMEALPDHDSASSECDKSYANQHYTDPTMERTEFSFQAAVEEIYRVLTTSECPPPPSATQNYRVRVSVDLNGEAVTPSFRVLPQSAKIKEICDRLSGHIGDPDNAKAFFTESQVPALFSGAPAKRS